jgi:alpha-glucosidase
LPPAHDYPYCNVEQQGAEPDSMLTLYRQLIAQRRAEPALSVGNYRPVVTSGSLVAYVREANERRFLVVLNLGPRPAYLALEELRGGEIALATDARRKGERVNERLVLVGDDAVVLRID